MQINNNVFLDAIRSTLPNHGDVSENALTLSEIMELTGLSRDKARVTIGRYIDSGEIGITKAWRTSKLGGYEMRVPAYYYKGQNDEKNLGLGVSENISN